MKYKDIKVSVALASHNGEKYIRQQLQSIAEQTFLPSEIVICDDKSSDLTCFYIKEFSASAPFVVNLCKNKDNLGFVKNFEKAISLCQGEYIAISDQDDIWHENKLKLLIENINDNLLIHSDAILIDKNNNVFQDSYARYSGKYTGSEFVNYIFGNHVTGCTTLFKRELLSYALPIPEGFPYHDWWLALHAAYLKKLKYYDAPLVYYRQHGSNQIGAKGLGIDIDLAHLSNKNRIYFESMSALIAMRKSNFSFKDYTNIIDDYISYYKNLFIFDICLSSFIFRVKYFKYFLMNYSLLVKLSGLISSLFGLSLQKKIYKFYKNLNVFFK